MRSNAPDYNTKTKRIKTSKPPFLQWYLIFSCSENDQIHSNEMKFDTAINLS